MNHKGKVKGRRTQILNDVPSSSFCQAGGFIVRMLVVTAASTGEKDNLLIFVLLRFQYFAQSLGHMLKLIYIA